MVFRLLSTKPRQRKQEIAILTFGLALLLVPGLSPLWWSISKAKVDRFCAVYPVGSKVDVEQVLQAAGRANLKAWNRKGVETVDITISSVLWLRAMRICEMRVAHGRVESTTARTFMP